MSIPLCPDNRIKALLTLFTLIALCFPAWAGDHPVAIVNAVIIDGNGGPPLEGGALIIREGKIEAVGSSVKIPGDAKIIDADGRTE